jgi:hypothetical protein
LSFSSLPVSKCVIGIIGIVVSYLIYMIFCGGDGYILSMIIGAICAIVGVTIGRGEVRRDAYKRYRKSQDRKDH